MKKNYIILFNGLGNQIGQLALYLYIKEQLKLNAELVIVNNRKDQASLSSILNINSLKASKNFYIQLIFRIATSPKIPKAIQSLIRKNNILNIFEEKKDLNFISSEIQEIASSGGAIFIGGWHNKNLHDKCIDSIFDLINDSKIKKNISQVDKNKVPVIGVHIRGKDYLTGNELITYGNIATSEYYLKAIIFAKNKFPNAKILYFTDDKDYVKKLMGKQNIEFSDGNTAVEDFVELMSCDGLIIGNSSFAYWAARLNKISKFVVRPNKYTNYCIDEIYPENWIDIKNE